MKRTNKKGFTIVELVIVIAIIAILAAVLIPTFSTIIQKAQTSSDTQLIRNLNTALLLEDPANDGYATAYDAIKACERQGYKVDVIVSKSKYNIAFDNAADHFILLDADKGEYIFPVDPATNLDGKLETAQEKMNVWVVSDTVLEEYSTYYTGSEKNIVALGGFDAGDVQGIETITYSSTANLDILLRANSPETILALNAPSGDVYFFGSVGKIVGIEGNDGAIVAPSSLHIAETAEVTYIKIQEGHIDNAGTIDIIFATTTAVSVTNTGDIDHAHVHVSEATPAADQTNAATINSHSSGVTFDHDKNVEQNANPEVYHHVTTEEAKGQGDAVEHGAVVGDKGIIKDETSGEIVATDYDPNGNGEGLVETTEDVIESKAEEIIVEKKQAACEHNYVQHVAVAVGCENDGNNEYWTCDKCNAVFKADKVTKTTVEAETIAQLGHDYHWNNVVGDGKHTLICSHDSNHKKTEDCDVTNNGDICSVCGYEKVDPYLAMLAKVEAGTAPSSTTYTSSAIAYYWDTVNDSNCGYIFDVYTKDDTTDLDFEKARNTSSATNWVILLKDVDLAGVQYPKKPAVKCNFDFNGHTVSLVRDKNGLCVPLAIGQKDITIKSSKVASTANIKVGTSTIADAFSTTSTVSSIFYTGNYNVTFSDIIIDSGKEIAIANNGAASVTLQNCTINSNGFSYSQTLTSNPRGVYNSLICMLRSSTSTTTNLTLDNCNITMDNAVSATAVITYLDRATASTKLGKITITGGTKITTCNDIPIFDLYETEDSSGQYEPNQYNLPNIHYRTTHCLVLEECSFNQSLDGKTGTMLDPNPSYNTSSGTPGYSVGYKLFNADYHTPYFNLTDCVAEGYELSATANADGYWTVSAK